MLRTLLLTLLAGLVLPGSAGAVLAYQRTDSQEIVVAADDGSNPKVVTRGTDPVVSPSGRSLAFLSLRDARDRRDLRLIPTSGGRSRLLARDVFAHAHYSPYEWSPDSRHLIAASAARSASVLVEVRSRKRRYIPLSISHGGASFAPDGKSVVIEVTFIRDHTLATLRLGESRARHLRAGRDPVWGRGGLAFADEKGLRFKRRLNSRTTLLLRSATPAFFPVDWSADGRQLLAVQGSYPDQLQALLINRATGEVLTLPPSFSSITMLSADAEVVLGEMNGNVVAVTRAGEIRILAEGAISPSWSL